MNRVEAQDILTNHVEVCRPIFPQSVSVVRVADRGDIVRQRIQPDVHMLFIVRHRHAPAERRPRD